MTLHELAYHLLVGRRGGVGGLYIVMKFADAAFKYCILEFVYGPWHKFRQAVFVGFDLCIFRVNLAQSVLVAYEFKRQITYAVIGVRTEDFLYIHHPVLTLSLEIELIGALHKFFFPYRYAVQVGNGCAYLLLAGRNVTLTLLQQRFIVFAVVLLPCQR